MKFSTASFQEATIRTAAVALFEARNSLECTSHSSASQPDRSNQPHMTMPDDAVIPVINIPNPGGPRKRDILKRAVRKKLERKPLTSTHRPYIHPLDESPGRRMRHTDDYLTERNPNPKTGLVTPETISAQSSSLELTVMPTPDSPGAALALPMTHSRERSRQKHRWRANKDGWYYVERSPSPAKIASNKSRASSSHEGFHSDRFAVVTPAIEPQDPLMLGGNTVEQVAAYEHYARRARDSQASIESHRVSLIERIINSMPGALPADNVPSIALAELDTTQPPAPPAERTPSVRVAFIPRKPVPSSSTTPPAPATTHNRKTSWFTGPSGTAVSRVEEPPGETHVSTVSDSTRTSQPAPVEVRLRGSGARRGHCVSAVPAPPPPTPVSTVSRRTRIPTFSGPVASSAARPAAVAARRAAVGNTTDRMRSGPAPPTVTPLAETPDSTTSCEPDLFQDLRTHMTTVFKTLLALYLLYVFLHVVDAVREAAWRASWPARGVVMIVRFMLFGWGS